MSYGHYRLVSIIVRYQTLMLLHLPTINLLDVHLALRTRLRGRRNNAPTQFLLLTALGSRKDIVLYLALEDVGSRSFRVTGQVNNDGGRLVRLVGQVDDLDGINQRRHRALVILTAHARVPAHLVSEACLALAVVACDDRLGGSREVKLAGTAPRGAPHEVGIRVEGRAEESLFVSCYMLALCLQAYERRTYR
jgi:hypothetical protein